MAEHPNPSQLRLLDRVRDAVRLRHYGYRRALGTRAVLMGQKMARHVSRAQISPYGGSVSPLDARQCIALCSQERLKPDRSPESRRP